MKKFSTALLILLITISTFAILSPQVKCQPAYLTEFTQLTTNPMKDRYPICSPDGSTISYYAFDSSAWYRHLWSMNPDGSGKTPLTSGNVIDQTCDYSPDGSKIMFMKHRGGTTFDLMILHLDTSITETFLARGESLHDARWSNNGDRITFILMKHGAGIYEIHMMDIDGTNEVTLVSGTHHPITHYWSPDDTKIVYSSSDGFWVVNTSPPYDRTRIYETSQEAIHCAYSPDGNYIIYTTRPIGGDYQDLYLMDKDGNFIAQLTFDASIAFPMEWSANGDYIVFCSNRAGNEDIWRAQIHIETSLYFTPPYDESKSSHGGNVWGLPVPGRNPKRGSGGADYSAAHDSSTGEALLHVDVVGAGMAMANAIANAWFGDSWTCSVTGTYEIAFTWDYELEVAHRAILASAYLEAEALGDVLDLSTGIREGKKETIYQDEWKYYKIIGEWDDYSETGEKRVVLSMFLTEGHTYCWYGVLEATAKVHILMTPALSGGIDPGGAAFASLDMTATLSHVTVELKSAP